MKYGTNLQRNIIVSLNDIENNERIETPFFVLYSSLMKRRSKRQSQFLPTNVRPFIMSVNSTRGIGSDIHYVVRMGGFGSYGEAGERLKTS